MHSLSFDRLQIHRPRAPSEGARTTQAVGKARRLGRIFRRDSGRSVVVPLDGALIAGPHPNLSFEAGLPRRCAESGADALLAHIGTWLHHDLPEHLGRIVNLSASTTRSAPTRKAIVATVDQALALDADAVACQIHIGSRYETGMLQDCGEILRGASAAGMVGLVIAYARSERVDGTPHEFEDLAARDFAEYIDLCCHAVRVAVELGADVIKTHNPGTREALAQLVQASAPVPLLIAGGNYRALPVILSDTKDALLAGAAGVSIGRGVYEAENPEAVIHALTDLVHGPST